jgi:hypothetical protein
MIVRLYVLYGGTRYYVAGITKTGAPLFDARAYKAVKFTEEGMTRFLSQNTGLCYWQESVLEQKARSVFGENPSMD